MKMNKYLISAFGALSLIAFNACSTEDLAEPSSFHRLRIRIGARGDGRRGHREVRRGERHARRTRLAQTPKRGSRHTQRNLPVDEVLDMLGECELERIFR